MTTSLVDADSLLAIDVGTVNTRAILFDVVDGRYRFLAAGIAPTTALAPYHDVGEGVRSAIDQLQAVTGRTLVDSDEHLILPSKPDGTGIDTCVATLSVGKPLSVVAVGLLEDVSSESAQRLASTTYAQVMEKISLNDRRKSAARLDAILRVRPDLIIVAGGTDGGASHSILTLLESVGLACYLMPPAQRPEVLFVGNRDLVSEIEANIGSLAHLAVAPNIRPTLENEQLAPAQAALSQIFRTLRCRQIPGVQELDSWTGGKLMPTATAFSRIIRYLSLVYEAPKGALGVDIGASAITMAASFNGDMHTGVYTDLGLGQNLPSLLNLSALEDIMRWVALDVPEADVRDYLYNKGLYPSSIPMTPETLSIEQALARRVMQIGAKRLASRFPQGVAGSLPGQLPWFEPVLAAGSALTNAPTLGQAMLMLLDGLQLTGITTIVLDQNNLSPALGAVAQINSILPIQVLSSSSFMILGSVISVVGNASFGTPALKVKATFEDGSEAKVEVKYGGLEVIPLPQGQKAVLQLMPYNRFDVGTKAPGRSGTVKLPGGALGIVIDARGRPVRLPSDPVRRREMMKKWLWMLGG